MSGDEAVLAGLFLQKAQNDLVTARQTLLLPDGPTDTVCFHAQQAVEKALKGLLTARRVAVPRIHNLVRLLDMILPFVPELARFREVFARLSAHAVAVRYPGDFSSPLRDEAMALVAVAEEVVGIIRTRL